MIEMLELDRHDDEACNIKKTLTLLVRVAAEQEMREWVSEFIEEI